MTIDVNIVSQQKIITRNTSQVKGRQQKTFISQTILSFLKYTAEEEYRIRKSHTKYENQNKRFKQFVKPFVENIF